MDEEEASPKMEVIGPPCGRHGPYTFFKYCHCKKPGYERTMKLGDFFFLNIMDTLSLILAELQLVWRNRSDPDQLLCSLRVYYQPEQTPEGRLPYHDQNELLCCTEKIVVKAEDLVSWLTPAPGWKIGLRPPVTAEIPRMTSEEVSALVKDLLPKFDKCPILLSSIVDAVTKIVCPPESAVDRTSKTDTDVHVVSFNRYCRLRALLVRMRQTKSPEWLRHVLFHAISGIDPERRNVKILFCRRTFESEDLKNIPKRCDYLAPNLKGRPRKRCRLYETQLENRKKARRAIREQVTRANKAAAAAPVVEDEPTPEAEQKELTALPLKEKDFMKELRAYMKELKMPLGKVPCLGGKSIDLFKFYKFVQDHGGYQKMCDRRLWKRCYEHLKCPRASTAAATQTRRHYEKLLLPYEAHQKERACQIKLEEKQKATSKRAKTKPQTRRDTETEAIRESNGPTAPKKGRKTKAKTKSVSQEESSTQEAKTDSKNDSKEPCPVEPEPVTPVSPVLPVSPVKPATPPNTGPEIIELESESEVEQINDKHIPEVPKSEDAENDDIDLRCSEELDTKFVPVTPIVENEAKVNEPKRNIVTQTPGGIRKFESQSERSGKFTVSNLSVELSGTIYDYVSNVIGQALIKDKAGAEQQNRTLKLQNELSQDNVQDVKNVKDEIVIDDSPTSSNQKPSFVNQNTAFTSDESKASPKKPTSLSILTNPRPSVIQSANPLPPMPPLLPKYEPISPPTPEIPTPLFKPQLMVDKPAAERQQTPPRPEYVNSPKFVTALSPSTRSLTPQKSPRNPWAPAAFTYNLHATNAPVDDLPLDLSVKAKVEKVEKPVVEAPIQPKVEAKSSDTGVLDLSVKKTPEPGASTVTNLINHSFSARPLPKLIPLSRTAVTRPEPAPSRESVRSSASNYWNQNHLNPYSNGVMYTARNGATEQVISSWDKLYAQYSLPQSSSSVTFKDAKNHSMTGGGATTSSITRPMVPNDRTQPYGYQADNAKKPEVKTPIFQPYSLPTTKAPAPESPARTALSSFGPEYVDYMNQLSYLNQSRMLSASPYLAPTILHNTLAPSGSATNLYMPPYQGGQMMINPRPAYPSRSSGSPNRPSLTSRNLPKL